MHPDAEKDTRPSVKSGAEKLNFGSAKEKASDAAARMTDKTTFAGDALLTQPPKDIESAQSMEDNVSARRGSLDAARTTSMAKNSDLPALVNEGQDRVHIKSLAPSMVEESRIVGHEEAIAGLQQEKETESQSVTVKRGRSTVQESSSVKPSRETARAVTHQDLSLEVSDSTALCASKSKHMTPKRRTRGVPFDAQASARNLNVSSAGSAADPPSLRPALWRQKRRGRAAEVTEVHTTLKAQLKDYTTLEPLHPELQRRAGESEVEGPDGLPSQCSIRGSYCVLCCRWWTTVVSDFQIEKEERHICKIRPL